MTHQDRVLVAAHLARSLNRQSCLSACSKATLKSSSLCTVVNLLDRPLVDLDTGDVASSRVYRIYGMEMVLTTITV